MGEYHSPLGGSVAHRFINCPGSIVLSGNEDRGSNLAADTGTVAHALAAKCLVEDRDAWEFIGVLVETDYQIEVDKDMADGVQVYLDYIRQNYHPGPWRVEERFHLPELHKHFAGTADFVAWNDGHLIVLDYKNGSGIVVEAVDNPQLLYYAAGAAEQLDLWGKITKVTVGIVQPNAPHALGPVRTWEVDPVKLASWLSFELLPAMHKAETSEETNSGPWCSFCPCLTKQCPALMEGMAELEELLMLSEKKGAEPLTTEQTARVLDLFEVFKKQHSAVMRSALARSNKGAKIPGWKNVTGRGNRVFKEGAPIEEKFGSEAFAPRKLKTPAQIEKLPKGKEFVSEWAIASETGNKLVPASDSRSAEGPAQKSMFQPIEGGQ